MLNIIKGIVTVIQYLIASNAQMKEAGIVFEKDNMIDSIVVDKKKVNIYHIKNMYMLGIMFGGVLYNGIHRIMVDDNYMNASNNLKQFIISHECGHIANKHYSKGYIKLLMGQLKAIANGTIGTAADNTMALRMWEKEIEADRYAASVIGASNAIDALRELYAATPQEEIAMRIMELGGEKPENPFNSLVSIWNNAPVVSIDEL